MPECEVFDTQEIGVNADALKGICEYVLERERDEKINLILLKLEEMPRYNAYRNKEGPTDVLSFEYHLPDLLGEVYVCPEYVRENAEYFGVSFNEELARVCIHGVLHLCGYDHETNEEDKEKMFRKQEDYLSELSDSLNRIS